MIFFLNFELAIGSKAKNLKDHIIDEDRKHTFDINSIHGPKRLVIFMQGSAKSNNIMSLVFSEDPSSQIQIYA